VRTGDVNGRSHVSAGGPSMSLAQGITSDRAAVVNGLTLHWSTGPVEGHVTRVKLFI
jgi:transposase